MLYLTFFLCFIAGVLFGSGIVYSYTKKNPSSPITPTIKCEYKTSKDYDRLYDLVMIQKQTIIQIKHKKWGLYTYEMSFKDYKTFDKCVYINGENVDYEKMNTKEKFIAYCTFNDIEYLDFIVDEKN